MRVIIAGGGELGARIAEALTKGNEVVIIEKDKGRAEYLGEKLHSIVLLGDATEKEMLRHASADKCDALLALTADDKTNSEICGLGKHFKVKKIMARLNSLEKAGVYPAWVVKINMVEAAAGEFRKAIGKARKK